MAGTLIGRDDLMTEDERRAEAEMAASVGHPEKYLVVHPADMETKLRKVFVGGGLREEVMTRELFCCATQDWNIRVLELVVEGHPKLPEDHPPYLVEVWEQGSSENLYSAPIMGLSGAMSVIQAYLELAGW